MELVVRSDTTTTPQDAEATGEYIVYGGQRKEIFRETRPIYETQQILDPTTGQPMYKRGPGGITLNSIMTRRVQVGTETKDFLQMELGNGQTVKVYDFRESEESIRHREREARKSRILDQLVDRLADSPGALDAVLNGEFPKHIGGPKWELSNGESFVGSREKAEAAEAQLR
jgi:hypothetical protein